MAEVFGWMIAMPLGIAGLVFWWRMLCHCLANEHGTGKLFWCLMLTLPNFAGLLVYYFVKWRPKRRAALFLT
jgi:hypothetical protein